MLGFAPQIATRGVLGGLRRSFAWLLHGGYHLAVEFFKAAFGIGETVLRHDAVEDGEHLGFLELDRIGRGFITDPLIRVGSVLHEYIVWYYYEQNERENGKAYLQFAAERGDTAAEEALKAINNGVNARLLSGVLNLFRHASRVIDDRAKAYAKSGMMQGVDKKLREQIRQKKEGLGMRMG